LNDSSSLVSSNEDVLAEISSFLTGGVLGISGLFTSSSLFSGFS